MGCKGEVPPEVLNLAEECLASWRCLSPDMWYGRSPLKMPGDGGL